MPGVAWKTQYGEDFRYKKRYQRPEVVRVSSPHRRNNPHPVKDFLIYNRKPVTTIERQKDELRRHLMQEFMNRPTRLAPPRPRTPPHDKPDDGADKITSLPLTQAERHRIRRPKTTVAPVIRGDFIQLTESSDITDIMSSRDLQRFVAGNLSPRKPASSQPRPYTQFKGYGMPVTNVGALDLQAPNFTYATGQHRPVNNYTVYGPPPPERRPMHQHQSRKGSSDDYLHNHSIFASTNPGSRGYYIINPDWVSERFSMRRAKSLLSF